MRKDLLLQLVTERTSQPIKVKGFRVTVLHDQTPKHALLPTREAFSNDEWMFWAGRFRNTRPAVLAQTAATSMFMQVFPLNVLTDWQREEKASLSAEQGRGFDGEEKSTGSIVNIPSACVIRLPRDPPEETAPSSSSSKRLGMSCTANDGIYIIHRASPRPCLSFLAEAWPVTVTNPQREGGERGGGGKDVICASWSCASAVCQQSTAVQINAHLCCCCVHVHLKAGGKRREIMEMRGQTHSKAAASIAKKEGSREMCIPTRKGQMKDEQDNRFALWPENTKTQCTTASSTGTKKRTESKKTGNPFSKAEEVVVFKSVLEIKNTCCVPSLYIKQTSLKYHAATHTRSNTHAAG